MLGDHFQLLSCAQSIFQIPLLLSCRRRLSDGRLRRLEVHPRQLVDVEAVPFLLSYQIFARSYQMKYTTYYKSTSSRRQAEACLIVLN